MILSVSRRTDIPANYAQWFFGRLREGRVMARNPRNARRMAEIPLNPQAVDAIVFWTKNPAPLLDGLPFLAPYPYYVQITITAYGEDVEPRVPSKEGIVLPAVRRLADAIGPERVVWRYDPILLSRAYTAARHLECFARIARALSGYTRRCVIGFVEAYANTRRNAQGMGLEAITPEAMHALAGPLARIARAEGMEMAACCEPEDFAAHGIGPARCIDAALLERIAGRPLGLAKDRNQRALCGCAASVDIGAYNTCLNGCLYCYANYNARAVQANAAAHDVASPLLVGNVDAVRDVVRGRN